MPWRSWPLITDTVRDDPQATSGPSPSQVCTSAGGARLAADGCRRAVAPSHGRGARSLARNGASERRLTDLPQLLSASGQEQRGGGQGAPYRALSAEELDP